MAVVVCVPITDIQQVLNRAFATLPGLGQLRAFRDSLDTLPSPSQALSKFIGILNLALMPLRQIAQILAFITAVVNCTRATIESIRRLSPQPILDCTENLLQRFNELTEYMPPKPYQRALASILLVFIEYLDEIIRTLVAIDARITEINAMRVRAAQLNDANLELVADCAQREVDMLRAQALDGIQALMSIVGSIQQIISTVIGALEGDTSGARAAEINAQLGANLTPGSTGLSAIADQVGVVRELLIPLYRLLSMGLGDFLEPGPAPSFTPLNP